MPGTSPNVNQQAAESTVQGVLFQLLVQHRADLHQGTAPFTAPTTAVPSGRCARRHFTHLHDCHCPLSLTSGAHNVLTVLLISTASFPGVVPERGSSPRSVCLCSQQSASKPFFPPFPVFLSLRCSPWCLAEHFISSTAHFRAREGLFVLFLLSGAFQ